MTDGWPMRFMASPRRRPTTISAISCERKMTSDARVLLPSAAREAGREGETHGGRFLLVAYGVAGFAALACEVAWSRARR